MPYLSEGANIVSYDAGNILLVSERRSNLRKLLDIIDIFDNKVFEGDRVRLLPVQKQSCPGSDNGPEDCFCRLRLFRNRRRRNQVPSAGTNEFHPRDYWQSHDLRRGTEMD